MSLFYVFIKACNLLMKYRYFVSKDEYLKDFIDTVHVHNRYGASTQQIRCIYTNYHMDRDF
jgi:hypothetical protein